MALFNYKNYYKDLLILQYKTQKKARETVGAIVSQTGCTCGEFGKAKYVVVGHPTIVDGVASGFTQSDYLLFDNDIDTGEIETLEVGIKFTTGSSYEHTFEGIFGTARCTFGFYLTNEGELRGVYLDDVGTHDNLISSGIQFNKTYYAKMIVGNGTAILSISEDGEIWSDVIYSAADRNPIYEDPYYIVSTSPFTGSLDLNVTYVKINGKTWGGYSLVNSNLPSMIINGFDLNTAEGVQLDIIGKYIGLKRVVKILIGNSNTNVLNDEQYRLLLKLKLLQNTNFSSTSQIRSALYSLFPTSIRLYDRRNMTYEYELSTDWNELINVIIAEELLPRPMAIGVNVVSVEDLLELYGYSDYSRLNDNPNGYSDYENGFKGRYLSYGDRT